MKKIILLIILSIVLVSCGDDSEKTENVQKGSKKTNITGSVSNSKENIFYIETKNILDFSDESNIEKFGKVISSETIDIKSQVSGKLEYIYVKEGERVNKNQVLAKIDDLYSKYYLDLDKAEIDYEKQIINKESQIISLDKKITDAKIILDDSKLILDNARITLGEDRKKAEIDYKNSDIIDTSSQAYLELEKAKLDYENILNSNAQQISSYIENVKKEYNNLILSLGDVIKFSDELFGVTTENKNTNDSFEDYLGAKKTNSKSITESNIIELIKYKEILDELSVSDVSEKNIIEIMDNYYLGYDKIKQLLSNIEVVLNNSIPSIGTFSENDIDNYLSKVNSFQSQNQGNLSSFTSTKSSINSFLNTYLDKELLSLKNVELQEKKLGDSSITGKSAYNKVIVNIENSLNSYETKYKQALSNYENAVKNKDITVKSLNNSIASAKNNLNKANVEYSKLNIVSPISGIISSINIDNNTNVTNGSNIFTVISNDNTQVEILLSDKEISAINIGDPVNVKYLNSILKGSVYSKSSVANNNLEFKVKIILDQKINLIGGSTMVELFNKNTKTMLPLDIIKIKEDNIGYINLLVDGKKVQKEVELGKIDKGNVEIYSDIEITDNIIITDLENFNEITQILTVNNK